MTHSTTSFSSAIYSDLPLEKIYMPEMVIAQNSHLEPSLNDLKVGDDVEVWSANGDAFKGTMTANAEEVHQFRKLVAGIITRRIYSISGKCLHELSDDELEALLIHRGLNN